MWSTEDMFLGEPKEMQSRKASQGKHDECGPEDVENRDR